MMSAAPRLSTAAASSGEKTLSSAMMGVSTDLVTRSMPSMSQALTGCSTSSTPRPSRSMRAYGEYRVLGAPCLVRVELQPHVGADAPADATMRARSSRKAPLPTLILRRYSLRRRSGPRPRPSPRAR